MTSYVYLLLVPFAGAGLAFGIGHVSPAIYLPLWLLNAALMTAASWLLGLHAVKLQNQAESRVARTAFLFIVPWILISMFAGLGPPPETAAEWAATAHEQQVRYFMLVIAGVFIALGFVGLRDRLQERTEAYSAQFIVVAIFIAIPLFIINMLYWGFYLSRLFIMQTAAGAADLPDWFQPTRQLFSAVSAVEVSLTYLATAAAVLGLKKAGLLRNGASFIYLAVSLLACAILLLSLFFPESLLTPGNAVSIPAAPFLLPYLFAVNLLRRVGNKMAS
jgi:hypothetical protein